MREVSSDHHRALVVGPIELAAPSGSGPLDGVSFVAKDLFDVAGHPTGAGNPDVLAAAEPARVHATAVERLLAAGATCVGKAHTVETAYGLSGVNDHYGTPVHPLDPVLDPGGSSSGSAVAVAAGLCDVALGTDTAGSVRVPASYCGLVGFRPTHGRVPVDGVFPLAPRFDTVGWLTRDGSAARALGSVLLDPPSGRSGRAPSRVLVARDLLAAADRGLAAEMEEVLRRVEQVVQAGVETVELWGPGDGDRWADVFRTLQRHDAWAANREWIERLRPRFGPRVAPRWEEASQVSDAERDAAETTALELVGPLHALLGGDTVLVLPSAPGPAPRLDLPDTEAATVRSRLMSVSTIAPVAAVPEVSLPLLQLDGLPVGVGLMASPGNDELLLDLAAALA